MKMIQKGLWTTFVATVVFLGLAPEGHARKHLCKCRGQTTADLTPHPGMTPLQAMRAQRLYGAFAQEQEAKPAQEAA